MTGLCPKCGGGVTHVNINRADAHHFGGSSWLAITYNCPHCATVLSVGIDPLALKTDTINGVVAQIAHLLGRERE